MSKCTQYVLDTSVSIHSSSPRTGYWVVAMDDRCLQCETRHLRPNPKPTQRVVCVHGGKTNSQWPRTRPAAVVEIIAFAAESRSQPATNCHFYGPFTQISATFNGAIKVQFKYVSASSGWLQEARLPTPFRGDTSRDTFCANRSFPAAAPVLEPIIITPPRLDVAVDLVNIKCRKLFFRVWSARVKKGRSTIGTITLI